jgi:hypothetical protein
MFISPVGMPNSMRKCVKPYRHQTYRLARHQQPALRASAAGVVRVLSIVRSLQPLFHIGLAGSFLFVSTVLE